MGTFASIQARVRTRLIDLPTPVSAEVPNLVVEAIHTLQDMHDFKVMETLSAPYLTTALQRSIGATPSDMKEVRSRPYRQSLLGTNYPMIFASAVTGPSMEYGELDKGSPKLILDGEPDDTGARVFKVWPLPDGVSDYLDGEYRIIIPYYRYLPTLVNPSDSNWFTINAEEWIVRKATAEGFAIDWDEQRVAFWEARAKEKYDMVVNRDKRMRLAGVTSLVPLWQGANSPQVRW